MSPPETIEKFGEKAKRNKLSSPISIRKEIMGMCGEPVADISVI